MKENKQETIRIGQVDIPIINDGDNTWYPISYICQKVIHRTSLDKKQLTKYKDNVQKYLIDFTTKSNCNHNNIQECWCFNYQGITEFINTLKVGSLNLQQKQILNELCKLLKIDRVFIEKDKFVDNIQINSKDYDEYTYNCVDEMIQENKDVKFQLCTKCNKYYPYHTNFFEHDPYSKDENKLNTICRTCKAWTHTRGKSYIQSCDNKLTRIYYSFRLELYRLYKNKDIIGIYEYYLQHDCNKAILKYIQSKEHYLKIISYCVKKHLFDEYETIDSKIISKVCKIGTIKVHITKAELMKIVNNISVDKELYFENVRTIFNTYLSKHNIIIEDVFSFPYYTYINKAHLLTYLRNQLDNCTINFIMQYWNYEYPAYMFQHTPTKFYDNKQNRINDLKYLI